MVVPVYLLPIIKDALVIGGSAAILWNTKPALAPGAPPNAPKPMPKGRPIDNGPAFGPATGVNVVNNNTTYNITPPSVSPGVRVVYVDKGNRVQPKVNINIKAPPSIPKRKLKRAGDGQDATKTARKSAIKVSDALENHVYGQLLHIPLTGKKEVIVETLVDDLAGNVSAASEKNADNFALWLAQQTGGLSEADREKLKSMGGAVPYWDATALIMPQFINGFDGTIGFIYGLEPLHEIATYCRDMSLNARQEVTGWVPSALEIKQSTSRSQRFYKEPPVAKITNTGINGVATALEFDWGMETTPEELLKGYGLWQFSKEGTQADFEEKLKTALENDTFDEFFNTITDSTEGNRVQIKSLPRLLAFLQSANFFRAGYHRLPQVYPEYLVQDKMSLLDRAKAIATGQLDEALGDFTGVEFSDMLEIHDWQTRQLDAFFGEWATTLTVKDAEGEDTEIHLPNLAEAIGELFELVFNINLLTEHGTQLQIKQMAELMKLFNMGTMTHDHAVAISKYLGYTGETKKEEVPFSFDFKAENIIDFQKPTTHEIVRWENTDQQAVKEDLLNIGISAGKAASAVWRKWKPGEPLPGEKIKQEREEARKKADEQWAKWIQSMNTPTGLEKTDAKPTPKVDNVPISKNQDDY